MYAFMADIHLGVKLPNEDFMKSLNMFLGLIKEHPERCHGIFVLGDLFDHRLSIDEAKFASLFLANLVCNQCGENSTHVPVYFIHGTYSHDLDQYEMFLPILMKIPDTKVFYIKTVSSLVLDTGIKVLCIPHETGDIDYSEFLNDKYDIIAGHGVLVSNTLNPCHSNNGIIHSSSTLGKISKLCVFGHYHGLTSFGSNTYYIGPWLRWKYGEDEERVFFFCDDKFQVQTKRNPFALEFKTITINNPEELRDIISKDIQTPHRFKIEATSDDIDIYRGIILSTKQNQNIKYQFEEIEHVDDSVDETPEININDTISARPIPSLIDYIKLKYDVDATDKLTEYESLLNKDKKDD